jgi:hypothetical protein
MAKKATRFGLIEDNAIYEEMAQGLEQWAKAEEASVAMLNGEVLIRK